MGGVPPVLSSAASALPRDRVIRGRTLRRGGRSASERRRTCRAMKEAPRSAAEAPNVRQTEDSRMRLPQGVGGCDGKELMQWKSTSFSAFRP